MIHALLLCLSLSTGFGLSNQGPAHAGFHPAEADAYVELGDISALLPSLDKTPMLRFLRDERLKALFAELGQSPELPLPELVQQGLARAFPEARAAEWVGGLRTVSASIVALGPGSENSAPVALLAMADFATAVQAEALRSALEAKAKKHEPAPDAPPGVELLHLGDKPADDLWCVTVGSRLVVGGSASKVQDYLARAEQKLAGLAGNKSFQKQLATLGATDGVPVLWFALARSLTDIAATTQKEGENATGLALLKQLPADLNPLGSARVARMSLLGERFVTEIFSSEVSPGATTKAVDPAWLEPVPAGSMIVYSSAFDGAWAGKRMRELLAKDEQSAAPLAALEQRLGFGPERVLARLGPGMTVYAAPFAGLGLPETRLWIDCDDAAAFTSEFEAMVAALGETLPGFQAKTKPYKLKRKGSEEKIEVPVTTLTLPPDMLQIPMISLSPSFAAVGKKLVFGFNSMDVKNELKRVHSGAGEPISPGANPLGALGFQLPPEARSVFVMDWGKLLGSVVGTFKAFAGMAGPEAFPFDLKNLPPGEMFAEYFKPTFYVSQGATDGVYRRNDASFGPETWLGLFALVTGFERQQASGGGKPSEEAPPPQSAGGGQ